MAESTDNNKEVKNVNKFTKEQLLKSKKYIDERDILSAVLKDNNSYVLETVDKTIKEFKRKKVK